MISVANRRVECAITATLTLRRAEWDCHETAWLTRSLTFVLGSPVNGNALYGCMVSVANRRVECVHHAGCNSVCISPTTTVCPERARTAVQHVPWTVAHAARVRSGSQRGRRATRFLDSGARCFPIRIRSGNERGRRNSFVGLLRTLLPRPRSLRERVRAAQHIPWTLAHPAV